MKKNNEKKDRLYLLRDENGKVDWSILIRDEYDRIDWRWLITFVAAVSTLIHEFVKPR